MSVYLQDPDVTIYHGDALRVLRSLPAASVDCCVTSPPFYGLRDYGVEGQIGLESSPDEWVARLVEVFAEVRRVLVATGSLWIECGDSYHGGGANPVGMTNIGRAGTSRGGRGRADSRTPIAGVKPKDLLGQPFLLAFALRADGWYWRGCYPWAKPNAMPESAKDRCTTAHSYVLHFAKQSRYFFDGAAISEPAAWERWGDQTVPKYEGTATSTGWMQPKTKRELQGEHDHRYAGHVGQRWKPTGRETNGQKPRSDEQRGFDNRLERADGLKHPRSVWTIPTQGFREAHFAAWPEALAEKIIKASCPEGGTVLDPFGGSGTTALVARKHGRRAILIELNEDYCRMAARRLQQLSLLAEAAS